MGEMDLIYLVVGVGLGIVVSRVTHSLKKPEVSTAPRPQGADQGDLQPLKEELKQTKLAYEMAKEMSQFKAGFLARTSHELRSPLSTMFGTLQLILSDLCDDPAEEREFVEQAHVAALKLVKLI